MSKQHRSNTMASIHEIALDLNECALINKTTMKEFDKLCLTPIKPMSSDVIRNHEQHENDL